MRSDFCYAEHNDEGEFGNYFMIHPEFELETSKAIPEDDPVPTSGIAGMWIVVEKMRSYHQKRIRVGVKGFMVSGLEKIAEVEVIEIVSLDVH